MLFPHLRPTHMAPLCTNATLQAGRNAAPSRPDSAGTGSWMSPPPGILSKLQHVATRVCLRHRFAAVLSELDDSSTPDYIRSLTDAHRSHVFDIVMQFRAIFYDDDDAAAADGASPPSKPGAAAATPAAGAAPPVLCSWAQHRAHLYVERLDALLPMCAPTLCPRPLLHSAV